MSSVIQNQNRTISATVTTPPVSSQSRVYVTVPAVPVCCKVQSVRLACSANIASWSITILTDGAAHRVWGAASNVQEQNKRVVDKRVSPEDFSSSANVTALFDDVFVKDETETGNLHLLVATKDGSNFANNMTFTVTVQVTPTLYMPERTAFSGNRSFRVLRKAGNVTDLTQQALRNGNPYLQGSIDQSESFILLNSDTDEVYIGMDTPFPGVLFSIPALESFRQGVRWDISTGTSTWSAVAATDLFDNTSEGHSTTPSGLSYTGTVKIKLPQSTWASRKISDDPLTELEAAIVAGTAPYQSLSNPSRYWLRLRAASGASFSNNPLKVTGIQPLV